VIRHCLWKLVASVIVVSGFCAVSAAQNYTFTEWATPSTNSHPLHIVSGGGSVYYFTESARDRIASLDTSLNAITEWLLPPGSVPHAVEFSSGTVYICAYGGSYIGLFNPATGSLTMWVTPTPSSGSIHLDLFSTTQLYFSEANANKIGFLDTTTGEFNEWPVPTPNSIPRGVAVGQGSQVFFVELYGKKVGMLDTSSNTITEWALPWIKEVEHLRYSGGLVYFCDLASSIVGTLNPATNQVTGWQAPTSAADIPDISVSSGNIYFTERNGNKIGVLNPSLQAGTVKTVTPTVTPVSPTQNTVSPTTKTLTPVTTPVTPTGTNVGGAVKGGFTEWAIPTTGAGPLGIYQNGSTTAFAEYSGGKVATLSPAQ
jgi:virginiamycin B lyase